MRVVIDTNVFISGIFWTGSSNEVILAWKDGKFTLVTSISILSELSRVLSDFKIQMSHEQIQEWIEMIRDNSEIVEPCEKIKLILEDPSDDMFIEAALTGNAEYLISQDNHLLRVRSHRTVKIVTPEEFIRAIKESGC